MQPKLIYAVCFVIILVLSIYAFGGRYTSRLHFLTDKEVPVYTQEQQDAFRTTTLELVYQNNLARYNGLYCTDGVTVGCTQLPMTTSSVQKPDGSKQVVINGYIPDYVCGRVIDALKQATSTKK